MSAKELREEMRCYLSCTDHKVFEGMIPLEETLPDPAEEFHFDSKMDMIVTVPKESATKETPWEPAQEKKCPKFPGWEKVLHPSQLVAVVGKPPCPSGSPGWTYMLEAAHNKSTKKVPTKILSPAQELEVAHQWKPTPSFMDVTTCLRDQLSEEVPKMPPIPVVVGMMAAPGMATMSTSQVVWDKATGATYLDTVTTSVGRVALSVPEDETIMPGPKIEDIMDLL